ncbi:MAG: UDP-3-O-(3-hydroxymyristoyl)glucosamine N-acyltransferase [Verrucomicrobia bacterium]|nr:UDP-3-O-(3-hydroxymyristoyl)glucosamine N-acyltransferase [Verrucomicrobiota bacterium]
MHRTSAELADFAAGKLEGDPSLLITGVAGLREARDGQVSFLEHPRYAGLLAATRASVVLVAADVETPKGRTVIRVSQPGAAFSKMVALFAPAPVRFPPGVHPRAHVDSSASVHPSAAIQPFAVIEAGVRIGANTVVGAGVYIGHEACVGEECMLYAGVVVRERCLLGNRVILHPGVVIGSDGFGYEFVGGHYEKVPQVGIVQIEDDVEIGANTTVDRGRFGRTWIKRGVKIDNLVQIAHNVIIDEHTAIAAQAGISGSTIIGKHVRIAGQVGTVGHIEIGDGAILYAQSGVHQDVPPGQSVFGYPAQEHKAALKTHAHIRRLPRLIERIRKLEEQVRRLTASPS